MATAGEMQQLKELRALQPARLDAAQDLTKQRAATAETSAIRYELGRHEHLDET